ncbi:MAG: hypothetical protein C4527_04855 [Candidatus Omnitrophota bacterium]|nr:MAG: hypothetical protein C4527_04855 [Candidatus Omnitrophota bacterium]
MPFQSLIDAEKQLTVQTVQGTITFEEAFTALKTFYSGNPMLNVIWDFREGTIQQLTANEIKILADYVAGLSSKRAGGKTAGVTPNNVDYGLGRMFATLTDGNDYQATVRIFRRFEDAMEWIYGK